MNISIFVAMLLGLQVFYGWVGRRASRSVKGQEEYFLAGKGVSLFPLMMTFVATQIGGGGALGAADEAYRFGWPVLLYPLGMALGLSLLGCGIGRKLAAFPVSTVAQVLEVVYRSSRLKQIASLLSVTSLFMILVAQIIASSRFLFSLKVDNPWLFIGFWAIVILYTTKGGLKAVISTDLVQAAFFSVVFLGAFGLIFFIEPSVSSLSVPSSSDFATVSSKLSGWLLMPLLFMLIEQDMGQRCFAGASPTVVSRAAILAGAMTLLICIVPVFCGVLGRSMGIEVPPGESALMVVIVQTTNPWVASLVGCAILAAIVSTATSLINAISSNLSSDFQWSVLGRENAMRWVKGMTAGISIGAIFFAFCFDNVVDILIQSYELSVSCLCVPVVMALFRKTAYSRSAWWALIGGAIGFVLFRCYPTPVPKEVASVLLSLLGYFAGELSAQRLVEEP